jgi:ATP-dependent Clp protease adaptor protein ClpS
MPTTLSPPEIEQEKQAQLAPPPPPPLYNVVLLDDNDHTYDYVVEMLTKLFAMSKVDAYLHAEEVDSTGRTVVITCGLSEAEFGRDQIHNYGPDYRMPNCRGSMKAIIEPAGTPQLLD